MRNDALRFSSRTRRGSVASVNGRTESPERSTRRRLTRMPAASEGASVGVFGLESLAKQPFLVRFRGFFQPRKTKLMAGGPLWTL